MSLLYPSGLNGLITRNMTMISREQLQFQYSWNTTSGDDPRFTGKPDSDLLNRSEGYEVLHLLNGMIKKHGWTIADCLNAERKIHHHNALAMRSRSEWERWLIDERSAKLYW